MSTDAKRQPWAYLEAEPAPDAPPCDNPSGLYCPPCRAIEVYHCAWPEYCGEMRRMRRTNTGEVTEPIRG